MSVKMNNLSISYSLGKHDIPKYVILSKLITSSFFKGSESVYKNNIVFTEVTDSYNVKLY
jgi:hypothetical protein